MAKLKLGPVVHDKPLRVTIEIPSSLNRDLAAYAAALAEEAGSTEIEPIKLIVPMVERFISTDRGFAKFRRGLKS